MRTILVVANQTVGGAKLLDLVKAKAAEGDTRFYLVVPRSRPRYGGVIYDEAVRDAAEVRLSLARQFMSQEGIDIQGEVGDEDPFNAAMDAIAHYRPDEVIISTLPRTSSGWLRRDLVERIEQASGLPVEHVEVDLEHEGLPFGVTLVLANQTVAEPALIDRLKAKAAEGREDTGHEHGQLYIVVVPQDSGDGRAVAAARERLWKTLAALRDAELLCAGMIGDPEPYTAAMNAIANFRVNDIIISTLEPERSGWLRAGLVDRVREETGKPVEHVVAGTPSSTEKVEA